MEEKVFNIHIPEGYEIDTKESSLENGVIKFKKKTQKEWSEFGVVNGFYIDNNSEVVELTYILDNDNLLSTDDNRNIYPTEELAEAALALCQLLQWRNKAWEEDNNYKPNWNTGEAKHCIIARQSEVRIESMITRNRILVFSSYKIAETFLKEHEDLINKALPLL